MKLYLPKGVVILMLGAAAWMLPWAIATVIIWLVMLLGAYW